VVSSHLQVDKVQHVGVVVLVGVDDLVWHVALVLLVEGLGARAHLQQEHSSMVELS
jgi:hypothetical protein